MFKPTRATFVKFVFDFLCIKNMDYIPVVNLSGLTTTASPISDNDWRSTAAQLFSALSGIGFAYLSNHGVSHDIIERAFVASRKFFELPPELKDESLKDISISYNGYAKPGQELLHPTSTFELRESYDFCGKLRYIPESCEEFGPALTQLEEALKPLVKNLLRTFAISLNLADRDYFLSRSTCLDGHNVESHTTLRSLYYPPIGDDTPGGSVKCADHTDCGMFTLLLQDSIGGLEVKSVGGAWIPATPIPGTILLNTGDLMDFGLEENSRQRYSFAVSNNNLRHHQILIPEGETKKRTARQSIVFFVHPDYHVSVKPLTGRSADYAAVSAKEHASQRISATYQHFNNH